MHSILARSRRPIALGALLCLLVAAGGCAAFDDWGDKNRSDHDLSGDASGDSDEDDQEGADTESEDGESSTVCGREVAPSPALVPVNPCSDGDVIVDETYERTTGKPDEATASFDIEANSEICVQLENIAGTTRESDEGNGKGKGHGDEGEGAGRLSAAWIYVDGDLVAGPDDFDQGVENLRRTLDVPAGSHEVNVRLASKPGAKLGVTIRAAEAIAPAGDQPTTTGDNGILEVSNVAVDHPLFSPNGDGYHDTALFNADNVPDDSQLDHANYDYHLEWSWSLIDADSCQTADTGITGTTQVNSPTNVQAHWDGTDTSGSTLGDGNYLYEYTVDLVRSDGAIIDSATATARGIVVDSNAGTDYGSPDFDGTCDASQDPDGCQCPDQTPEGVRCTFGWIPYIDHFDDPAGLDTSQFVTTTQDTTGRYEVVVDLRSYNAGGLVPQHNASYADLDALQDYVSTLTGVPADPNDTRLFNFDYVQLGYSTPVVKETGVVDGFNHFLLDVITDKDGKITIDGQTIDLKAQLASDETPVPEGYAIQEARQGEHCGENGNTDGETTLKAKACTRNRSVNLDPGGTNLGIYTLQWQMFDVRYNGEGTTRDTTCIINGIFKCGVRTFHRDAELTAAGQQFVETTVGEVEEAREVSTSAGGIPSLVVHTDRRFSPNGNGRVLDGICSRSMAAGRGMRTPLDTATGAVSPACIINGIF